MAALNLVVIRAADVGRSRAFYEALGLTFTREKHGGGPEHFSAEAGGAVFEIYPQGDRAASAVRLGFRVASVDDALTRLSAASEGQYGPFSSGPSGLRAVVIDPDGNKVELTEASL